MGDEFAEYKRLIMSNQERFDDNQQAMAKDIAKLATEVAVLKVKMAMYAAMGGGAATLAVNFLYRWMAR